MKKINNKGFTLIELLVTLAIIVILMLILIPSVLTLQQQGEEKNYQSLIDSIKSSASLYVSEHRYELGLNCTNTSSATTSVTLSKLVEEDVLTSPVINPKTGEEVDLGKSVTIIFDCKTKNFSYEFSLD